MQTTHYAENIIALSFFFHLGRISTVLRSTRWRWWFFQCRSLGWHICWSYPCSGCCNRSAGVHWWEGHCSIVLQRGVSRWLLRGRLLCVLPATEQWSIRILYVQWRWWISRLLTGLLWSKLPHLLSGLKRSHQRVLHLRWRRWLHHLQWWFQGTSDILHREWVNLISLWGFVIGGVQDPKKATRLQDFFFHSLGAELTGWASFPREGLRSHFWNL